MDSDDDFLESTIGKGELKNQHQLGRDSFEDIARELEEDTPPPPHSRSEGEGGDDPDAWLLGQYEGDNKLDGGGVWTSDDDELPRAGMDIDAAEELEADLLNVGKSAERGLEPNKLGSSSVATNPPVVEEKAIYTSSGRLLVPSHKSREAKAAAGATARAWEEMEAQGLDFSLAKKKAGGSKSKSKPAASKAPTQALASGSGAAQSRSTSATATKSTSSKSKLLTTAVNKSAAAGLAHAATKAALAKSKKKGDGTNKKSKESRSRSESRQVETPAPEAVLQAVAKVNIIVEPAEEEEEDNRLYCICKTKYDEERSMIACDRCDDWYHPSCVGLPETDVDLVDQFVCPPCVSKYNAHTTYRTRCAVQGCTKPAQVPVSKYCSPACGLKNAAARLQTLQSRGVDMDQLWYAAKDARAPEGVVYVHLPEGPTPHPPPLGVNNIGPNATKLMNGRLKADVEHLTTLSAGLGQLTVRRAALEMGVKRLKGRLRLLGCAVRRAEKLGGDRCGFDVRMVMEDEEWAQWSEGDGKWILGESTGDEQKDDNAYGDNEGFSCTGKKRCERHSAWQNLKFADFSGECAAKESQLVDMNNKLQDVQRKLAELKRLMSSMARPPTERLTPKAGENTP